MSYRFDFVRHTRITGALDETPERLDRVSRWHPTHCSSVWHPADFDEITRVLR